MELTENNLIQNSPTEDNEERTIPIAIEQELWCLIQLWRENGKLIGKIDDRFANAQNPYLYLLELLCYGKDFRKFHMPSLLNGVCQEFKKWLKNNNSASEYLTLELKSLSLEKLYDIKSTSLIHFVCEIFEIQKDIELLKPSIDEIVAGKNYKQACYLIISLNLQDSYSFDEVLFPLLCQNLITPVHDYLENNRNLQIQFVKDIDAVCESEESVSEWVKSFDVQPINIAKFPGDLKWLQKVLSSYLKKCNIPLEHCKNLIKKRSWGALNYLFNKFFIEKTMSEESWKEMIMNEAFTTDLDLQNELITKLLVFNKFDLALELTEILKIPQKRWPEALVSYMQNISSCSRDSENNDSLSKSPTNHEHEFLDKDIDENRAEEDFLTLRLDEKDIILVDSIGAFESCINDIAINYDLVGIDAEWRPTMGICEERVSVLQLATWDNIYLIDVLSLMEEELKEEHWCLLMEKIFCNPQILKLGFGIKYDLSVLRIIQRDTKAFYLKPVSVLDFGEFFQHICDSYESIAKHFQDDKNSRNVSIDENEKKGLSLLCVKVLGKRLKKVEQFSDWRRRPLRNSQIVYAALDAYCLLQIFEKLYSVMANYQMSLRNIITDYLTKPKRAASEKKKEKSSEKPKQEVVIEKEYVFPPKNVSLFKTVVDSSLSSLGKKLRVRGADVCILDDGLSPKEMVKMFDEENRVILCSGGRYEKIRQFIAANMILNVPTALTATEQVTFVCKHFNIICTVEDVLTRCMLCNCNKYLKVSSEDLQLLWTMKNTATMSPKSKNSDLVPFITCSEGFITEEGLMQNGKEIQMSQISSDVLLRGLMFFICSNCGKIYWEGSHHSRTQKTVSDWIEQRRSEQEEEHKSSDDSDKTELELVPCSASVEESSSLSSSRDTSQTTKGASASISHFESDGEDDNDYDVNDLVY